MSHDLENTTHVNHTSHTLNEEEREMSNTAVADVAGSQSLRMQNRTMISPQLVERTHLAMNVDTMSHLSHRLKTRHAKYKPHVGGYWWVYL